MAAGAVGAGYRLGRPAPWVPDTAWVVSIGDGVQLGCRGTCPVRLA